MSGFDTTRWSLVVQARGNTPGARVALESLCRIYRPPVLAYVRDHGHAADAAEDLVQTFFLRFLDQAWHASADPTRGRFRAYLLTALKRYLIDCHLEAHTLKRGGGMRQESLGDDDQGGPACDSDEGPERAFERAWALAVVGHALDRLGSEAERAGKRRLFEALREFLIERPDETDYERVAATLKIRRNTLAVAVHRLRHRLRELVREELAETAADPAGLDAELRELRAALGTVLP